MYRYNLVAEIEQFIEDEIKDSMYYHELAHKAPSSHAREMLMELSIDEKNHSENFKQAYYYLTGKLYSLSPVHCPEVPDFEDALKMRILSETKDYQKYGEHYIEAPSKYFKDLFFKIKTVEGQHAMRIPILLEVGE